MLAICRLLFPKTHPKGISSAGKSKPSNHIRALIQREVSGPHGSPLVRQHTALRWVREEGCPTWREAAVLERGKGCTVCPLPQRVTSVSACRSGRGQHCGQPA